MIADYFRIAFRSLKERKTRSSLTILGIVLAIVTIFVLLSLSLGLKEVVNEQFEMLGGDKFFIQPKGQAGAPGIGSGAVELSTDDVNFVEKIKGVGAVTYFTAGNGKIEFKEQIRYYLTLGLPVSEDPREVKLIFEASGLDVDEGRMLKGSDRKKILVGYNYKYRNLFDKDRKSVV